MGAIKFLNFEDWLEHAFGAAVPLYVPPWFLDPLAGEIDYWDPPPQQAVEYLTRLFENGPKHLKWFSDAQVAQGLSYLVDSGAGMQQNGIGDPSVPAKDRAKL